MGNAVVKNLAPTETLLSELPFEFDSFEVGQGRRPEGFRFYSHVITITAAFGERKIIACGEANDLELATAKAISELIERASLLKQGITKNSNGWAAHPDRQQAKLNAIYELVERDAVLAQWYSRTPFVQVDPSDFDHRINVWATTELSRSEFPHLKILLSTQGIGPSVTCLLMNDAGRGVCSHSTKESLQLSVESAIGEACRAAHLSLRRAFWNDTIALKNGEPRAIEPVSHGLYYAYHEAYPDWMFGELVSGLWTNRYWGNRIAELQSHMGKFEFQTVLESPVVVGFVKNENCFPLGWGPTDANEISNTKGAKRLNLSSDLINIKPHIIS